MKGYERRAAGRPDYYKIAVWDDVRLVWVDGKKQFESEAEAVASVSCKPGRYRVSLVADGKGRTDLAPFTVGGV